MKLRKLSLVFGLAIILMMLVIPFALADGPVSPTDDGPTDISLSTSHRLIVQLESPPLAVWAGQTRQALKANGRLDVQSAAAQSYVAQLQAEQAAFISAMQAALPGAAVDNFVNELGVAEAAQYQITFNGMSVDPGSTDKMIARRILSQLPGVRAVYLDFAHTPTLYTSTTLINAPALWNNAAIGGRTNAGAGVKVASVDGGLHKDAPMFDGTGFSYPTDFPPHGLGLTANNNGKIIASRAYFRSWDPPAPGDENPWPGENGTSHGVHTGGIAAGNIVTADYLGLTFPDMSGVAPAAWVMSYRVFYASVNGNESFFTTEGIAALEDMVADGADVVNNSWGEGPTAVGGEFDPLDQALINAANAGVFVSMSAGNAGPGNGTTDHPSDEYIIVAASTTSGTLSAGRLNVSAPEPVSDTLQNIPFAAAGFGTPLPLGVAITYPFVASANILGGDNLLGCDPWPAGTFDGKAALIKRGLCQFGNKVLNAENAGADFVIVYNHEAGGDGLVSMGAGDVGGQVTISAIFVGNTAGTAMADWHATNGNASELTLSTLAFQAGNTADRIISFSSRGPGVGNVLKPDIAAPGVNILSQGFTPGATGEARHFGFGQASGTSMAAPHVAGAAALVRQVHPGWSNDYIKSALMSTAKFIDIYNFDGTSAQPLDMGAGRLDLTNVADPGVILDPPSVSFGLVPEGESKTINVQVTSVTDQNETYDLSTLFTGDGFPGSSVLPGFSVSPSAVTLNAGATTMISITFDSTATSGVGDHQGYIIMAGDPHQAHMPAWARVVPPLPEADVLIIDNDLSPGNEELGSFADYLSYYTNAIDALGYTYAVYDAIDGIGADPGIPDAATLSGYRAILLFTGDYGLPDGTLTVSTPPTEQDQNRLTEYANNGGMIIAMGQDLASVLDSAETDSASFFYGPILGANWLQDGVSGSALPDLPVVSSVESPPAFQDISLHVGDPGAYVGTNALSGDNEVPPVPTGTTGEVTVNYDADTNLLQYIVSVTVTEPITITASHIHTGTVGVNGGVEVTLFNGPPTLVTETFSFSGNALLTEAQEAALLAEGLYVNVHTTRNTSGEVRAQLVVQTEGDGAGNQVSIDEIQPHPPLIDVGDPNMPEELEPYVGLLIYPGPNNMEGGFVAVAHREQPSLERPGIAYFGRTIYTSFGLEGVNDGVGGKSRAELLQRFLAWGLDEPTVTIADTTPDNASNLTTFEATLVSPVSGEMTAGLPIIGVSYRWDFGDGSDFAGPYTTTQASHKYAICGTYTVRVEATDSFGNTALDSLVVEVDEECDAHVIYLPVVTKNAGASSGQ